MAVHLAVLWLLCIVICQYLWFAIENCSTDKLHLDFRWRQRRHAREIRFSGFDALSSGGTEDGYCPASALKPDDPGLGTILEMNLGN